MRLLHAALQLIRPYTTLLAFLSVLVPSYVNTHNLRISTLHAIPLLFVSMCTFLINDLDDIERDAVNHPTRPLPSGRISPTLVVLLYYVCLAIALLSIRFGIANRHAEFAYYVLLASTLSYSYIVEYVPTLKAAYVAGTSTLPVLILAALYPHATGLYPIAMAVFLFIFGRELCLDALDREGDPESLLHHIDAGHLAAVAFCLQVIAVLLAAGQARNVADGIVALIMTVLLAGAALCWYRWSLFRGATGLMKSVMYLGLYFLVAIMRRS